MPRACGGTTGTAIWIIVSIAAIGCWIGLVSVAFANNDPSHWRDGDCLYGGCTTSQRLCSGGCSACEAYPCIDYSMGVTTPSGINTMVDGTVALTVSFSNYTCEQLPFKFSSPNHVHCWWNQHNTTLITSPPPDDSTDGFITGVVVLAVFAVLFTAVFLVGVYKYYCMTSW